MAKRRGRGKSATLTELPSLIAERPPDIQLATGKVLKDVWRDPQDDRPTSARTAREVSGYRAMCPLRKCLARHRDRSSFTSRHIEAADRLRACFDGGRIGFSGLKDWRPIGSVAHRPSQGPGVVAMRQLHARKRFDATWSMFGTEERALLSLVVLANQPVSTASARLEMRLPRALQTTVDALDKLADHFRVEEQPPQAA
jgi:hypothetical protein